MFLKNTKGFTLIELLVVISIIGLLTSVILVSLNTAREKARNARSISQLQQYQKAFEIYRSTYGEYPRTNTSASGAWACLGTGYAGGNCWSAPYSENPTFNALIEPYIDTSAIPGAITDPSYQGTLYRHLRSGDGYNIITILEGASTPCPFGTKSPSATYSSRDITRCDFSN
jgi:prepilin-type N-terminal cleavage/methylation domain-containing protein